MFSAFTVSRENRNFAADYTFHVDLGERVVFTTNHDCWASYIVHASIFNPEFLGVFMIDGDGCGNILEWRPDQSESGFAISDGSLALPLKGRVDNGELPAGRWPATPNA